MLRPSWPPLESGWGHLGRFGANQGRSWGFSGAIQTNHENHTKIIVFQCFCPPRVCLEASWASLGLSWKHVASSGRPREPSQAVVGSFENTLWPFWAIQGVVWDHLEPRGAAGGRFPFYDSGWWWWPVAMARRRWGGLGGKNSLNIYHIIAHPSTAPSGFGREFLTLRGSTSGHGTIREVVAEFCFLSENISFPCLSSGSRGEQMIQALRRLRADCLTCRGMHINIH